MILASFHVLDKGESIFDFDCFLNSVGDFPRAFCFRSRSRQNATGVAVVRDGTTVRNSNNERALALCACVLLSSQYTKADLDDL
jgi:hypothetical protein